MFEQDPIGFCRCVLDLFLAPSPHQSVFKTLVGFHSEPSLVGNPVRSATIISAQREGHTTAESLCRRGPREGTWRECGRRGAACCASTDRQHGLKTHRERLQDEALPLDVLTGSYDDSPGRFSPPMHCALAFPMRLAQPRVPKNLHIHLVVPPALSPHTSQTAKSHRISHRNPS